MIITLIAITAFLSLLHYTGTEYWLVYLVNQPIEYHLGIICVLVVLKAGKAVYQLYPTILGFFRTVARAVSRLDSVSSELAKANRENPFKNGGKRSYSTSRPTTSGSSKTAPLGNGDMGRAGNLSKRGGFNLLEAIRSKYVVATKMVPLSDKIGSLLQIPFTMNNILSMQTVKGLAWRIRLTKDFLTFVLKYRKHHGDAATVKWLKAQYVCLQKALGQDILKSTISLGTPLSYSRLAGRGLPRIIPKVERLQIDAGNPKIIRFWSGLFNLYRILKVPGELKISTITAEFTGNISYLEDLIESLKPRQTSFFGLLPGFLTKIVKLDLSPTGWVLSRSASPSNKVSAIGVLTDIDLLNSKSSEENRALWQEILYYLYAAKPKVTPFVQDLTTGYELCQQLHALPKEVTGVTTGRKLSQFDPFMTKMSIRAHGLWPASGLSQFAIKEEPAGKIRLFALLDSVTQSTLAPLHEALFALLKMIPNDGTFNQDASVIRSQEKAIKAGKAFSFDLTAATDRIPAKLTAALIGMIFQNSDLADSWLRIMTDRSFWFNQTVAEKLKVSQGPYRYAVGQPMGGLSSWAGLAITHHWVVQLAASKAYATHDWNTNYEILGDDLVIFDENIAREYLEIMKELGCEINLTKSIQSHNRPVFEFAKRTCWGTNIVSGISLAQIRAGWRVAGRVANALSFVTSGLISKPSLLAIALSRYPFLNGKAASGLVRRNSTKSARLLALGALSLFGTLYQAGKVSLKTLLLALANPHYEDADYSGEAVGLPLKAVIDLEFKILLNQDVPEEPFSKMESRESVYDEYSDELIVKLMQSALGKAKSLYENYDVLLRKFAQSMYFPYTYDINDGVDTGPTRDINVPYDDLPVEVRTLYFAIENFANRILGLEFAKYTPEYYYDTIYQICYDMAKGKMITFEAANIWLDDVEALEFKLSLQEAVKPGKMILESAPVLKVLRSMDPNRNVRVTYNEGPVFKDITTTGAYVF